MELFDSFRPSTPNLNKLEREQLLALANEARDLFEYVDDIPNLPAATYHRIEEAAELFEELVRVLSPELVTMLASHTEDSETRARWEIRLAQQANEGYRVFVRDDMEPIAHIVRDIEELMEASGDSTEQVGDALNIAQAALERALKHTEVSRHSSYITTALHTLEMAADLWGLDG